MRDQKDKRLYDQWDREIEEIIGAISKLSGDFKTEAKKITKKEKGAALAIRDLSDQLSVLIDAIFGFEAFKEAGIDFSSPEPPPEIFVRFVDKKEKKDKKENNSMFR